MSIADRSYCMAIFCFWLYEIAISYMYYIESRALQNGAAQHFLVVMMSPRRQVVAEVID